MQLLWILGNRLPLPPFLTYPPLRKQENLSQGDLILFGCFSRHCPGRPSLGSSPGGHGPSPASWVEPSGAPAATYLGRRDQRHVWTDWLVTVIWFWPLVGVGGLSCWLSKVLPLFLFLTQHQRSQACLKKRAPCLEVSLGLSPASLLTLKQCPPAHLPWGTHASSMQSGVNLQTSKGFLEEHLRAMSRKRLTAV